MINREQNNETNTGLESIKNMALVAGKFSLILGGYYLALVILVSTGEIELKRVMISAVIVLLDILFSVKTSLG